MKKLLILCLITFVSFQTKAQWTPLTDSRLEGVEEGSNYPVLKNGSFIYIGTLGGVYRSDLSGNGWTNKSNGIAASTGGDLEIYALTANTAGIYAATGNGLMKSTNNGDTWTVAITGLPAGAMTAKLFTFQNDLYAVVYDFSDTKLFSSTDDAGTWAEVYTFTNFDGNAVSTASAIYLMDNSDIVSSSDGITFTPMSAPPPAGGLQNLSGNSTYLFANDYSSIYRLDLGTGTWTVETNGISIAHMPISMAFSNDTMFASAVDYMDLSFALYRSTNNANNWTKVNGIGIPLPFIANLIHVNGGVLGWFPDGLFRSTDGGNNWSSSNTGLRVTSHDQLLVSGGVLLTPGSVSGTRLLRSTDAGNSFNFADAGVPSTFRPRAVFKAGSFLVAQFSSQYQDTSYLYKSVDNGQNWTMLNLPAGMPYWDLRGTSGTDIYITSDTLLFVSHNSGVNWSNVNTGLDYIFSITGNGPSIFANGYSNMTSEFFMESNDSGATWHPAKAGLPSFAYVRNTVFSANNIFTLADNDVYQFISNTWTKPAMNGLSTSLYLNTLAYHGGKLYVANDSGVYYSKDMGANWSKMSDAGLPAGTAIASLAFIGEDIFAGTWYSGIYKAANPFTWIANGPNANQKLQIFPNPASSVLYLNYDIGESAAINISIYDMNGRTVLSVSNEMQSAGQQQKAVNTSFLTPGIYNVVMRSENSVSTQKLMIAH